MSFDSRSDQHPFPNLDLDAVDFNRPARVQVTEAILPDIRNAETVVFPVTLADAIRFMLAKPNHEQERLEILTAPQGGKRGRVLDPPTVRKLYELTHFPK